MPERRSAARTRTTLPVSARFTVTDNLPAGAGLRVSEAFLRCFRPELERLLPVARQERKGT